MNISIKGTLLALSFAFASTFNAMADRDVAISYKELPKTAQQVINTNFPNVKVALSKKEVDFFGKSYDVIFTNGDKIEFDSNGNWEKISCKYSKVPTALIPVAILKYVDEKFSGNLIIKIEKEKRGYEVELQNGLELEFNKHGQCVKIDD